MTEEEYWFSATECFSCSGDLKIETKADGRVLVCKKCGVVNAGIRKESKK